MQAPSSPFPGMDPYLEDSTHWHGFHQYLADAIVDALNPQIVPKYYADAEVHAAQQELVISQTPPHAQSSTHHIYPDVAVIHDNPHQGDGDLQAGLAVREAPVETTPAPIERRVEKPNSVKLRTVNIYLTDSRALVTAIEIFSPANKVGENMRIYQRKRSRIIQSDVHLIEIDLLRGGRRPSPEVNAPPIDTDYIMLLNRADTDIYRNSQIWPVAINETLPVIPVPLLDIDPDIPADLNAVVQSIYVTKYYGLRIDYTQPVPSPKLRPAMSEWWQKHQK